MFKVYYISVGYEHYAAKRKKGYSQGHRRSKNNAKAYLDTDQI